MEKTATLSLSVNPNLKRTAETILSQLGIPMATAVDMFLTQITLTGGIPFAVTLPQAPPSLNADRMSASEIREKLREGMADVESGKLYPAKETFERFRDRHYREKI